MWRSRPGRCIRRRLPLLKARAPLICPACAFRSGSRISIGSPCQHRNIVRTYRGRACCFGRLTSTRGRERRQRGRGIEYCGLASSTRRAPRRFEAHGRPGVEHPSRSSEPACRRLHRAMGSMATGPAPANRSFVGKRPTRADARAGPALSRLWRPHLQTGPAMQSPWPPPRISTLN